MSFPSGLVSGGTGWLFLRRCCPCVMPDRGPTSAEQSADFSFSRVKKNQRDLGYVRICGNVEYLGNFENMRIMRHGGYDESNYSQRPEYMSPAACSAGGR